MQPDSNVLIIFFFGLAKKFKWPKWAEDTLIVVAVVIQSLRVMATKSSAWGLLGWFLVLFPVNKQASIFVHKSASHCVPMHDPLLNELPAGARENSKFYGSMLQWFSIAKVEIIVTTATHHREGKNQKCKMETSLIFILWIRRNLST